MVRSYGVPILRVNILIKIIRMSSAAILLSALKVKLDHTTLLCYRSNVYM